MGVLNARGQFIGRSILRVDFSNDERYNKYCSHFVNLNTMRVYCFTVNCFCHIIDPVNSNGPVDICRGLGLGRLVFMFRAVFSTLSNISIDMCTGPVGKSVLWGWCHKWMFWKFLYLPLFFP